MGTTMEEEEGLVKQGKKVKLVSQYQTGDVSRALQGRLFSVDSPRESDNAEASSTSSTGSTGTAGRKDVIVASEEGEENTWKKAKKERKRKRKTREKSEKKDKKDAKDRKDAKDSSAIGTLVDGISEPSEPCEPSESYESPESSEPQVDAANGTQEMKLSLMFERSSKFQRLSDENAKELLMHPQSSSKGSSDAGEEDGDVREEEKESAVSKQERGRRQGKKNSTRLSNDEKEEESSRTLFVGNVPFAEWRDVALAKYGKSDKAKLVNNSTDYFFNHRPKNYKPLVKSLKRHFSKSCGPVAKVRLRSVPIPDVDNLDSVESDEEEKDSSSSSEEEDDDDDEKENGVTGVQKGKNNGNHKSNHKGALEKDVRSTSSNSSSSKQKDKPVPTCVAYVVFNSKESVDFALKSQHQLLKPQDAATSPAASKTNCVDSSSNTTTTSSSSSSSSSSTEYSNFELLNFHDHHLRFDRVKPPATSISSASSAPSTTGIFAPNKTVFVGNLSWDTSEQILRENFSNVVKKLGKHRITGDSGFVENVRIVRDRGTGKCKGFGYVCFDSSRTASRILEKYEVASFSSSSTDQASGSSAQAAPNLPYRVQHSQNTVLNDSAQQRQKQPTITILGRTARLKTCLKNTVSSTSSSLPPAKPAANDRLSGYKRNNGRGNNAYSFQGEKGEPGRKLRAPKHSAHMKQKKIKDGQKKKKKQKQSKDAKNSNKKAKTR